MSENNLPFYRRLGIYLQERFPVQVNVIAILAFTFSAISYSRICRDVEGFIPVKDFLIGSFVTLSFFLLLRIFDEFKDAEDDAKYRKYLPVPRGLITLNELKRVGVVMFFVQVIIILIFHLPMIWLYLIMFAYLLLMGVEFFIPNWLRTHQISYIMSHMVIIPLVDLYASGLDWKLNGVQPHLGLAFFLAVSFMNGLVLEFGRKLRAPENEEPGVISYTGLYGTIGGTVWWIILLFITMIFAIFASIYAGHASISVPILLIFFIFATGLGINFIFNQTKKNSKLIEIISGVWTLAMYLTLGGGHMIGQFLR